MDPPQLHDVRDGDHLPEVPLGISTAAAYTNAAVHYTDSNDESHNHVPRSPNPSESDAEGRHRHVSLTHFDPSGVDELKRTMSRISERRAASTHLVPTGASHHSSDDSDHTLAPGEGPFDFEKALQQMVRRCVKISPHILVKSLNSAFLKFGRVRYQAA